MILIDLNEQADRDFGRARRRSWLPRLVSRLRGESASRRIPPSFDEARRSLRAFNRVRRGVRVVDLEKIVGSVGRRRDFDGESGHLITALLRAGNTHASNSCVALLKRVVGRLRERWPEVEL